MSDDWSLVPKRIKDFRILYKRKQEELGKALNLPKQAISAIERGKRKVNVEELSKISKFFNEPFDAFFAKEFKFDYYPKNIYGSFPKFIVDFLDDYKYFLDKLEKEVDYPGYDYSKTTTLKLIGTINEIINKKIKDEDERNNLH